MGKCLKGEGEDIVMRLDEAFDAAEALNVLAHDYGLYAVKTRLDQVGFKAGPTRDTLGGINERGRKLYAEWEPMAEATDPYAVPGWAEDILATIQSSES